MCNRAVRESAGKVPSSAPVACAAAFCIEALTCLGRLEAAAYTATGHPGQAAAIASEQLALARKTGTAVTLGSALRAYAAAVPAEDPGGALSEAVSLLDPTPARYELALALAQRTGAAALAEQARRELLATGARPRRTALTGPDALTSTERQVAGLAASGLSNRQIAQHLFSSQATVETHLRHAFGKLGITSRAELPAGLVD